MKKLTMNPNNKKYYSVEYIKGWEDGVNAQYEARLKGEWIEDGTGYLMCSNCKKHRFRETVIDTSFCPHCGADMRNEVM